MSEIGNEYNEDGDIKINFNSPPVVENEIEDADTEQEATDVVADEQTEVVQEVVEEEPQQQEAVQDEEPVAESPVIEEITDEEEAAVQEEDMQEIADEVQEAVQHSEATGEPLPEGVQDLLKFMEETGGSLEDYVNLNKDYSQVDNLEALHEYYRATKPHLSMEEVNFLIEDSFDYDEEVDDDLDVKRKKLALKEQVADAKAYLDGQKSKYYNDIKGGSKLTADQQKAIDFFNRYNVESEKNSKLTEKSKSAFLSRTDQVFNDKFKGFEYNVGDKKYRFNVKNAKEVKSTQSDINNFIGKFLGEDNTMTDVKGYHKSLYTAMNSDAIAQHFYEQGKADALKNSIAKSKNVSMQPRQGHGEVSVGGTKFKVLSGDSSKDYKIRMRKK